jgi:hypothetical protein
LIHPVPYFPYCRLIYVFHTPFVFYPSSWRTTVNMLPTSFPILWRRNLHVCFYFRLHSYVSYEEIVYRVSHEPCGIAWVWMDGRFHEAASVPPALVLCVGLETPHHNIKKDIRRTGLSVTDWIQLAEDRDQWRALLNMRWTSGSVKYWEILK